MEILWTDRRLAVVRKPLGLDSEQQLPEAIAARLGSPVFPLHRLDKNVAGLMVFARTREAAAQYSRLIQEGGLIKEYVALVHGQPPEAGEWTDLLFKDSSKNKVFVVKRLRKGVKEARLGFTRLTLGEQSLVRVRLYTGRSHQIRVQFASRGFPLVGDHKYGSRDGAEAPMLYSCALTFPVDGKIRTFEELPSWAQEN